MNNCRNFEQRCDDSLIRYHFYSSIVELFQVFIHLKISTYTLSLVKSQLQVNMELHTSCFVYFKHPVFVFFYLF